MRWFYVTIAMHIHLLFGKRYDIVRTGLHTERTTFASLCIYHNCP